MLLVEITAGASEADYRKLQEKIGPEKATQLDEFLLPTHPSAWKYARLCLHALKNDLSSYGYTEVHHIVPSCYFERRRDDTGLNDSNTVNFTVLLHWYAHYLLSKCSREPFRHRMHNAATLINRGVPYKYRHMPNRAIAELHEDDFNRFPNHRNRPLGNFKVRIRQKNLYRGSNVWYGGVFEVGGRCKALVPEVTLNTTSYEKACQWRDRKIEELQANEMQLAISDTGTETRNKVFLVLYTDIDSGLQGIDRCVRLSCTPYTSYEDAYMDANPGRRVDYLCELRYDGEQPKSWVDILDRCKIGGFLKENP